MNAPTDKFARCATDLSISEIDGSINSETHTPGNAENFDCHSNE